MCRFERSVTATESVRENGDRTQREAETEVYYGDRSRRPNESGVSGHVESHVVESVVDGGRRRDPSDTDGPDETGSETLQPKRKVPPDRIQIHENGGSNAEKETGQDGCRYRDHIVPFAQ
ncbi:hypothetical protein C481_17547 [Natrialba asiatica DSM 12278]|uniref:Uncharacterized protein n=1 Tax=Natrialba asiatica (strain ATCC 700177 / DSM 12278 / JCM 9576 / FERM P-10747 / NBRC 102637 / 172P1) TaxID=29540 RepID=M0AKL0_NATA1|nr:hypothetical protein C481_17547 [Natrialba asiatica DSM 12278]